ncbi:MAG: hypothetical protein R2731_01445 [Nocardioides sp.]
MGFYALVVWRLHGRRPLQCSAHLPGQCRGAPLRPGRAGPPRHRAQVEAIWQAVRRAGHRGLAAEPGRLCDWCHHQALCPAFGGTPPLPAVAEGAPDPSGDLDTDEGVTGLP